MAYCTECGTIFDEGVRFCPRCGANMDVEKEPKIHMTADDLLDMQYNKVMAALGYVGFLVFIPIFAAGKSKFARFHANQGLVLFILEAAIQIMLLLTGALQLFSLLLWVVSFAIMCYGVYHSLLGNKKPLPFIEKIKILDHHGRAGVLMTV